MNIIYVPKRLPSNGPLKETVGSGKTRAASQGVAIDVKVSGQPAYTSNASIQKNEARGLLWVWGSLYRVMPDQGSQEPIVSVLLQIFNHCQHMESVSNAPLEIPSPAKGKDEFILRRKGSSEEHIFKKLSNCVGIRLPCLSKRLLSWVSRPVCSGSAFQQCNLAQMVRALLEPLCWQTLVAFLNTHRWLTFSVFRNDLPLPKMSQKNDSCVKWLHQAGVWSLRSSPDNSSTHRV